MVCQGLEKNPVGLTFRAGVAWFPRIFGVGSCTTRHERWLGERVRVVSTGSRSKWEAIKEMEDNSKFD